MEFIIIWLIFGVISAIVASNKGNNGCLWFGLGVLLGPIGLIMVLVIPKNEEKTEKTAVENEKLKKCPQCNELIKFEATKCKHCSSDLASNENKISSSFCPNCGKKLNNNEQNNFCEICGYKLKN